MNSRCVISALAAATLFSGGIPVFAQGSGPDRNVPEIPNQPAPQVRPAAPASPQVQAPARSKERREQQHGRRDEARADGRRDHDHRHSDRRHWDGRAPGRGYYGYVIPQPSYYYPPAVYYGGPPVYYSTAPQTYYPYGVAAQLVFRPGDFLPPEYRQQQYVVEDWQWRGLAVPPYGYRWLLLGSDSFALVADSTGQILTLVAMR